MLLFKDIAIQILLSIVCLSSIGNDNKPMNAEHEFVPSSATNNSIVSDVNHARSCKLENSISSGLSKSRPGLDFLDFDYNNTSIQCFPTLKKNNISFELYNLTEQTKNSTVTRENLRYFGKTTKMFLMFCKSLPFVDFFQNETSLLSILYFR